MMINRLGESLAILLLAAAIDPANGQPPESSAGRVITIGLVGLADSKPDSSNSTFRGMTLGLEEARRTAALFGWDLVVSRAPDSLSPFGAIRDLAGRNLSAIVGDFSGVEIERAESARGALIFDIGISPDSPVGPCSDARFRLIPRFGSGVDLESRGDQRRILRVWYPSLERFGAGQLNERYRKRFGVEMDDRAWAGWMSIKIVVDATLRSGASDARSLEKSLLAQARFDGHKGVPLFFDPASRELVQPLFAMTTGGEAELVEWRQGRASTASPLRACAT